MKKRGFLDLLSAKCLIAIGFATCMLLTLTPMVALADAVWTGNEWNSNQVYAINREDPHANFIAYPNEYDALVNFTLHKEKSDYYYSLDGTWKFHWAHNPANRASQSTTPDFTTLDFNDSEWDSTTVPKNWQANFNADGTFKYDGYIYVTSGTPWGGSFRNPLTGSNVTNSATQPAAPQNYNPVATYRRTFTVPKAWKDDNRSVFVHFAGVDSNCYVWVNGHQVGYAEDSYTAKEFDITPYINYDGENVIVVQVFRWNSATWFELQDMNRLSGIFRSVGLVARAKVNLYDIQTLTTPAEADAYDGNWNLNIKALLRDLGATQAMKDGTRLTAKLYDAEATEVGRATSTAAPSFTTRKNVIDNDYIGADLELNININKPNLWSAEKPYLYKLVIALNDGSELSEVTCIRVGFREVKVINNGTTDVRFMLNGSRIVFHGVNAHEANPETGFAMNLDLIREDIELMKKNNINALRMAHYPHDTRYYDLADEYGLYVMDEANIECHGATSVVNSLANVNAWGPSLRDKINNMMVRDWNYPSVIIWSMGNENNSINAAAQTAWHDWTTHFAKAKDPSRTIHSQFLQNSATSTTTSGPEWYSGMYALVNGWTNTVNSAVRPTLQCEYAHAINNSLGNFDEYIEIFENPKTSGGFVWDWVDQSLWMAIPDNLSERYLSFGSDWRGTWGNPSSSGSFLGNGLISAERTEKPQMQQAKYGYRMLKADDLDMVNGTYTVNNKFSFTNANEYNMYWELTENGKVIQSGTDVLDINPAPAGFATTSMTGKEFAIPFTRPAVKPGAEYIFNVIFKEKKDTLWVKAGHVISENQMMVDFNQDKRILTLPAGEMKVVETDNNINITGIDTNFSVSINKADGTISSYKFKGRDLLVSGPAPNFWRPYNDNETGWYFGSGTNTATTFIVNQNWKTTGITRTTTSADVKVEVDDLYTKITVPGTFTDKTGATYETVYTVYPNGEVNVAYTYNFGTQASNHNYAPEIGSVMTVMPGFEKMTWYGRRGETYVDRKTGGTVGIHESTVTDNLYEYLRIQETGMKVDTRWFALTDEDGFGMIFKGGGTVPTPPNTGTMAETPLIQFNALHYRMEDMNPVHNYHAYELKRTIRDDITLRVAITSTGIGGDNCWGAYPMTQYRVNVNNRTYIYNYSILPVENLDNDFAGIYSGTNYDTGANKLQKYVGEIADNASKVYPDKDVELIASAKALSTANLVEMSELQDVYNKLVDAFGLCSYVAVYDSIGNLAGVSAVDAKALAVNGNESDFLQMSGLAIDLDYTAKVFIWDDAYIPMIKPFYFD